MARVAAVGEVVACSKVDKQTPVRSSDLYQVKVGLRVELRRNWTAWGQGGMQFASGNQWGGEALLGIKHTW
jgi:hypothetical protein